MYDNIEAFKLKRDTLVCGMGILFFAGELGVQMTSDKNH